MADESEYIASGQRQVPSANNNFPKRNDIQRHITNIFEINFVPAISPVGQSNVIAAASSSLQPDTSIADKPPSENWRKASKFCNEGL